MFTWIGRFSVRRRKGILVATACFVVLSGALGAGVFDKLQRGGFDDPHSESSRAEATIEDTFGQGDPNLVLLVTAHDGNVDSPESSAAGSDITTRLDAIEHVGSVGSYWSLGAPPPLRSTEGDHALVLARIEGDDRDVDDALAAVHDTLEGEQGAVTVGLSGREPVFAEIGETIEQDLVRAEAIVIPITLILLVLVFGSLVAASLPLLVGLVSIPGTFLVLSLLASLTDVSVFSINLTTALSLGLAIDYSLFVVSRFREELHAGTDPHEAVVRTVERAGRTVAFSALTVAVSLSALLIFPLYFLRSFAYAGIAVVVVASAASILSLPALLAVLGPRVDAGRILKRSPHPESSGFWHRIATWVMRRPVPIALGAIVFLVVLGLPFLSAKFNLGDERVLHESAGTRVVANVLRTDFASNEGDAFGVLIPEAVAPDAVETYAGEVSQLEDVARVDSLGGSYIDGVMVIGDNPAAARFAGDDGTWISVVPAVDPMSPAAGELVAEIRGSAARFDGLVGGTAAELVDTKAAIVDRLPWAVLLIALATFVLLFLMFGGILVPIKALVLNFLSLTATFGAMVWIFQDGNGSGLLDFTATGAIEITTPILMFCIAFGLSMDYEVFLLSRIKEEYDRTGDNERSVATGLEKTGRIVTAAAMLLAVTFLAFATSRVSFIKLFGVGLALAVLIDATVVRALLVPAFMKLAGNANWWAPKPLRKLHERFGIREAVDA